MSTQFQVEREFQIHFLSEGPASPGKNVLLCPLLTAWPIAGISVYYIVSLVCMSPFPHQTVNKSKTRTGFIDLCFPVQQAWYPRRCVCRSNESWSVLSNAIPLSPCVFCLSCKWQVFPCAVPRYSVPWGISRNYQPPALNRAEGTKWTEVK